MGFINFEIAEGRKDENMVEELKQVFSYATWRTINDNLVSNIFNIWVLSPFIGLHLHTCGTLKIKQLENYRMSN